MSRNVTPILWTAVLLLLIPACRRDGELSMRGDARDEAHVPAPISVPGAVRPSQATSEHASVASSDHQPTARGTQATFVRINSDRSGIEFENRLDNNHPDSRLYHSGFVCGGVATGDVDGDNLADVYLVSGDKSNKLYKNLGDFRFQDITAQAGVDGKAAWGAGAVMVDIDNDGDLDIYVCNYDAPNLLYVNDGLGVFSEQAERWNLNIVDASLTAAFQDYDCDGDLDVYLLNNRYYRKGGRPEKPPFALQDGRPVILSKYDRYYRMREEAPGDFRVDDYGRPDRLLRNTGSQFEDVSDAAGIAGDGFGLSATWWDYNADGWPDLYVCNDFNSPDRLYKNHGDGTFSDALGEAIPHSPWFSMGSDVGDINNDGLADFFCVDMSATSHFKQKTTMGVMNADRLARVAGPPPQYMRNSLYLNTGTGRFMEVAYLAGIADTDWSWAVKFADFDHDGRLDLFVSNGMVRNFNDSDVPFSDAMLGGRTRWDLYKHLPTRPEQNLVFQNASELKFKDRSKAWGLDQVGMSYGTALADLDNDQDLDMIVMNIDEPISVYRNDVPSSPAVTIRLQGTDSNRFGWGARLQLDTTGGQQVRFLNPATGFLSCNQPLAHFGLQAGVQPQRLTVDWPGGKRQIIQTVTTGATLVVQEPTGSARGTVGRAVEPMFAEANTGKFEHRETEFDDFQLQPLLPNRLSQLGPGIAFDDIDGDQDEDVLIGGAAGHSSVVLFNLGDGRYFPRTTPALVADAAAEDMGCLFFDADSDGDQDLYVVSGGVEATDTPALLQDRLYENQGQGNLVKRSKEFLPKLEFGGGIVSASDFDHDGDLDLFVGGRLTPGQYPLSPGSRLLRNDQGRFSDVTQEVAPMLLSRGMVSGALWSDVDGDGWDDLVVVGEWEPLRVYQNENGRLVDRTDATSTQALTGWFNGLSGRDVDGDGDIDFVATNSGLNTKYHASVENPALLYYGDFDGTGVKRLVEAEFEEATLFPIRGKSCSTHAMPFLGGKFETYRDFASASLADLYTDKCLDDSYRVAAVELQSGVFLNEGAFRFQFRPLPRLAQASPGFGVVVTEINGDTSPDIFLVQNFHGPQPETGNMDGGLGLLLQGTGDGEFQPIWPSESGLVVPGDAKSLGLTDANHDGRLDFFVGVNSGRPQCFLNQSKADVMTIRLQGKPGNAIGARVSVLLANGSKQTAEVYAGSSYLTQSTPVLTFGLDDSSVSNIAIEWPDGTKSEHAGETTRQYKIAWPQ